MRQKGSILVVVLGLLATLAVIGVAFLTMSSLERSTAASFALQTQMMIAADGALDYAVHQMVIDVWEWDVTGTAAKPVFAFTGNLLTGRVASGVPPTPPYSGACEPYDFRRAGTDPFVVEDTWLFTGNTTPPAISFAGAAIEPRFKVNFGGPTAAVDNLGTDEANGIWIPDLAAPCDQYLIRASVTVLDHNGLINLNAHGNLTTTAKWDLADAVGQGFFISDVNPSALGINMEKLLGRWGPDGVPGIVARGETILEPFQVYFCTNPNHRDVIRSKSYPGFCPVCNTELTLGNPNVPFTLDEEFALRRLRGTDFTSRLPTLSWQNRLLCTTVGWTAEVRGDKRYDGTAATVHLVDPLKPSRSARKLDLNLNSAKHIYEALRDSGVFPDDDNLRQFVANLDAFRDLDNTFEAVSLDGHNCVGAERQPFFSEITASFIEEREDPTDPESPVTKETWTIQVELFNPWPSDSYGLPDGDPANATGLNISQMTVTIDADADVAVGNDPAPAQWRMAYKHDVGHLHGACKFVDDTPAVWTRTIIVDKTTDPPQTLKGRFRSAKLTVNVGGNPYTLDEITNDQVIALDTQARGAGNTGRLFRTFGIEYESRSNQDKDTMPTPVVFIYKWQPGGDPNLEDPEPLKADNSTGIPIRIMNSVRETYEPEMEGPLPLRKVDLIGSYEAFARLGELNRVLCPSGTDGTNWWSKGWVSIVAEHANTWEANIKFNWYDHAGAANLFMVGAPWMDGLGDDGADRVAGKINLNTAIPETLSALASGVGTSGLSGIAASRPLKSPAEVIASAATPSGIEARDEPFTRISNIATVRSDVFSVYGTVQIVDPTVKTGSDIPDDVYIRQRRFWALVDRSPSLAYPPTDKDNFIYPRILNFQWLD